MLVYKSPLNHPQAVLFNLMLTACDAVICHLLMYNTGPTARKKNSIKGKEKKWHASFWFSRCSRRAKKKKNKSKNDCLFLLFCCITNKQHMYKLPAPLIGVQLCLQEHQPDSFVLDSLLTHAYFPHYLKKYDFLAATSHFLWGTGFSKATLPNFALWFFMSELLNMCAWEFVPTSVTSHLH